MTTIEELDRIAIDVKSHRLLRALLKDNPKVEEILRNSKNEIEARIGLGEWVLAELRRVWQARREALRRVLRRFDIRGMRRPARDPAERSWLEERDQGWFIEDEASAEAARQYYRRRYRG